MNCKRRGCDNHIPKTRIEWIGANRVRTCSVECARMYKRDQDNNKAMRSGRGRIKGKPQRRP